MTDTKQSILTGIAHRLAKRSETPLLDAQVLLAHVLGKTRAWVMAHPEIEPTSEQQAQIDRSMERLKNGQPLPYVLGHWEFFGLDFLLSPEVLIPRPETELLVEKALEWMKSQRRNGILAADIGTGSGCIAVALAVHAPGLNVIASDVSYPALQVAWQNARAHGVAERVALVQANLLSAFGSGVDLICANLPYITTGSLRTLEVHRHEPVLALDGGADGLVYIRRLLQQAGKIISQGCLLIEIEASQGAEVRGLAHEAFPQAVVEVIQDLALRDRVVRIALDR